MLDTTDFRKNLKIEVDGDPFIILSAQHVKPGKGVAFIRTKMKNMLTGRVLERNFRSGDKVGKPDIVAREMQYLYSDGELWHFMDQSNFEQVGLTRENVEEAMDFLIDNLPVQVVFYQGRAISVDLPTFVEIDIVQTDPGVKGDTAQGGSKPAILSTGGKVNVPLFVQEGEKIRIDTRTGEFVERVKG